MLKAFVWNSATSLQIHTGLYWFRIAMFSVPPVEKIICIHTILSLFDSDELYWHYDWKVSCWSHFRDNNKTVWKWNHANIVDKDNEYISFLSLTLPPSCALWYVYRHPTMLCKTRSTAPCCHSCPRPGCCCGQRVHHLATSTTQTVKIQVEAQQIHWGPLKDSTIHKKYHYAIRAEIIYYFGAIM